ncbi:MAG: 3'-5' exonuclease, partial [Clostridia bacterium]|nr:3'-5' exonuclease [Clostridia bacterium]
MEYLIFDTESCTGHANDGSICSFGYILCDENFNVLERNDLLINPLPSRFFVGDKKHAKKTGITFAYSVEEFRKAPRFNVIYDKIRKLFDNRIALGFSMVNDVRYLNDACIKYSLPIINYSFLDVQYLFKLVHPEENVVGLKNLCEKYGCEYQAHRADEDSFATLTVLNKLTEEISSNVQGLILKYGVKFGKNDDEGYSLNYCDAVIKRQFGLKPSNKVLFSVYLEYIKTLEFTKNKKSICFSHKIERKNVNYLISLIDTIYKKGMCFTRDADACDIFIVAEDEEVENVKRKVMKVKEFELKIDFNTSSLYDDEILLK